MTGTGDGEQEDCSAGQEPGQEDCSAGQEPGQEDCSAGQEDCSAGQAQDGRIHCVAHHQQRYHWDCGLSCCLMLLTDHNRKFVLSNLNKFVEEEGFGDSTWTIDLCYILHR